MFSPWIRRKSLKRPTKGRRLVVGGEPLNLISLLVLAAIFVLFGFVVVQLTRAFSGH